MRLWLRLVGLVAFVAVGSLLLMGAAATNVASTRQVAASQERLVREARFQAEAVSAWMRAQAGGLDGFRRAFRDSIGGLTPDLQVGLLRAAHRGLPAVATVALVGQDGAPLVPPVWAGDAPERPQGSAARSEVFLRHVPVAVALRDGVALSSPWHWTGAAAPSAAIAVRASESPPLVLAAEVELLAVGALSALTTSEHVVAVVDVAGAPLLGGDHDLLRDGAWLGLLGTDARWAYEGPDGARIYGAVAQVAGTPWSLVVAESDAEALRSAREIRGRMARILAGVVLIAIVAGGLAAQSIARPLGRLRDAALAVAEGRLGLQTDVMRRDEIGELATAFNLMSRRLAADHAEIAEQRDAIEGFNRELVQRVEERTAELAAAQSELVRQGQLAAVAEVGAGLAHELNNPLMSVLGIVQILRSRSDGRQAALLLEAEAAAQRCREVMAAMVRFGGDEVEASPPGGVDLATVARGVVAAVAPAWERRDLRIAMDDAGGAVPVAVGAHITGRVVAQVLSALRAVADPGTEVRVRAETGTGRAMLCFVPDRPVGSAAERRDDLRAASLSVWAARRAAEDAGGRLVDGPDGWRLEFPA